MADLEALHVVVPRTARYYMIGEPGPLVRDVWIACHGYSQLAARFAEPFRQLSNDTNLIVVPEALSRFYTVAALPHSGETAVGASWMTREDRLVEIDDIISYLDVLAEHIFELLGAHGVERGQVRVHALGFSQGCAAVCRWAARGATGVDHVVIWGSGVPPDVNLRALHEHRPKISFDVIYGLKDELILAASVDREREAFEASGIPFEIRTFEGGHTLNKTLLRRLFGVVVEV